MSDSKDVTESGTRREFLRGAGAVAGGTVLLAGAAMADAQTPDLVSKTGPDGVKPPRFRASATIATHIDQLGPLQELGGTWVGRGFNLISLPFFDTLPLPKAFRTQLNATIENLEFRQIGGAVPNRGSTGQKDINIFGLTYLQRISDLTSNGALHIEPGLWLHVPATTEPVAPATVVRQGSIPHGTSILAQGATLPVILGPPTINPADPTPFTAAGPDTNAAYLKPLTTATLPDGIPAVYRSNPNQALVDALKGQVIMKTQVLDVSTVSGGAPLFQGGGLVNIPSLLKNANAVEFRATFWIETVLMPNGVDTFMQLQYTQTLILNFLNISWPHISVATLIKQ